MTTSICQWNQLLRHKNYVQDLVELCQINFIVKTLLGFIRKKILKSPETIRDKFSKQCITNKYIEMPWFYKSKIFQFQSHISHSRLEKKLVYGRAFQTTKIAQNLILLILIPQSQIELFFYYYVDRISKIVLSSSWTQ